MMATDDKITPQEQKILQLLADGKPTKDVAKSLHLKVETLTGYMIRIREKLEADTTYNALATALRQGLID